MPESTQPKCKCLCKCFGWSQAHKVIRMRSQLPKSVEIRILYRNKIKVFFRSPADAQQMNYTDFDPSSHTDREK